MVAYSFVHRLTPNIALALAGGAGALVALASLSIPGPTLEDMVLASGIAAFVPAAEPPLGLTARICIGLFAGGVVSLLAWFALSALLAWTHSRAVTLDDNGERRPVVRRADAHPDARPRVPLRASELEAPSRRKGKPVEPVAQNDDVLELADDIFTEEALPGEPVIAMGPPSEETRPVAVEPPEAQELPDNLNLPLSAFDPAAIPPVPMAPPPPLRPLRKRHARASIYDEGERFETFELTPAVRPAPMGAPEVDPSAIAHPRTEASVHALLERLERGLAGRNAPPPPAPEPPREPPPERQPEASHGLEDTLSQLRRMAMRA
ncbi:hypothetical protein ABS767_10135 [Sphingomonas sp. ST-64]|uniref:Uncharacterized protein n=1 Tax=Sphingomonas plantiphila TaxID=3163295 RepID=A0ABW8YQF8_9SPHN